MMLLIKNGHVIDPLNHIDAVMDVAIQEEHISQVAPNLAAEGAVVIDAKGCYVLPGLIDHHCHIYPMARIGLPAEAVCFASGVTTAVDAGSTGCKTYGDKRPFLAFSKLSILSYLNVCSVGLDSLPTPEDVDPRHWDEGEIRACFSRWPDELLGLKLRTSALIVGYKPLKATIKLAERLGVSVMVHCTDPPGEMAELLNILRPGDILTHMYMNQGSALVQDDSVIRAAEQAHTLDSMLRSVRWRRAFFSI